MRISPHPLSGTIDGSVTTEEGHIVPIPATTIYPAAASLLPRKRPRLSSRFGRQAAAAAAAAAGGVDEDGVAAGGVAADGVREDAGGVGVGVGVGNVGGVSFECAVGASHTKAAPGALTTTVVQHHTQAPRRASGPPSQEPGATALSAPSAGPPSSLQRTSVPARANTLTASMRRALLCPNLPSSQSE